MNTTTTATTTLKRNNGLTQQRFQMFLSASGCWKEIYVYLRIIFSPFLQMEWKTQTSNSEFVKSDDGSSTRNKTLLLISYTDKVEKCKKKNA